ncbi:MAG: ribbon-helix-helix domain-containing protein [Acidimicrobiales bacterium]
MKLSVSLPAEDVEFLDVYARSQGIESRSAVVHRAVRLLRASELGTAYENAWSEWDDSDAADDWESVVGDGLNDASR